MNDLLNAPLKPFSISEDGKTIICGNCKETFFKAKRCTFCGQLIDYNVEKQNEKKTYGFEDNGIKSGKTLFNYLEKSGFSNMKSNALDNSDNYIILQDYNKMSFNWKLSQKQVRVNCKVDEMKWIESQTGYSHVENSDKVRPYSFLLNSFEELENVIKSIKQI